MISPGTRLPGAPSRKTLTRSTSLLAAFSILALGAIAQTPPPRITTAIDNQKRLTLNGNVHPKARPEYDQGRVSPSLALTYVTLTLSQTAAQKTDLAQLLAAQQTPGSPDYHRWLTPEEYAQRFGASQADVDKITQWLQQQGLTVAAVARGRTWIAFNGTASQIEAAFQTELHNYLVDNEMHFANSTEPSIPAAFDSVVQGIRGLNDFRLKPRIRPQLQPRNTTGSGNHYLAPDDFATIYDVQPLYAAGINGTGQKLVVAGQTQINLSDIETFRSTYNLPANDPQIVLVPNSENPGISQSDLPEADLDLEWSGAVARNATIIYVYSSDALQSVQYAIDQNLAPVVSVSYGECEPETSTSEALAFRSWAQQGNAQGITWFAASGDDGGADCDDQQNPGLSVDLPGSVPEVTSVGGTEFSEGSGKYWSATNTANGASALSYIPETSWNDSVTDGEPSASGGGASVVFSKPPWQTGPGVPSDNARDVPDISVSASADHDGYLVYSGGTLGVYGGTSVGGPTFAGVATLLNQYLIANGVQAAAGLGNFNAHLYPLAQTASGAFHDITIGNNVVTVNCPRRSRVCDNPTVGYSAGVAYDQVTGLGTLDFYKLVTAWSGGTTAPAVTSGASITLLSNVNSLAITQVLDLIATVTEANGVTPAGVVTFAANGSVLGTATLAGSAGTATATLVLSGTQLPLGNATITATYSGASTPTTASVTVNVSSSNPSAGAAPVISALFNSASYQQAFAPGGLLSVSGSNLAPPSTSAGQSASSVPLPIAMAGVVVLINGVAAPLYYVSPGQLNVQIPYQTAPNSTAVLTVNNNGAIATQSFTVAATAPGIFMNTSQNGAVILASGAASATANQEIAFYITDAGAVSPAVATGSAPSSSTPLADLPAPANVTVTVGGVGAHIACIGIPPGLVGVVQINITVPSNVPAGTQPLIVTVGGVPSAAAKLTITN